MNYSIRSKYLCIFIIAENLVFSIDYNDLDYFQSAQILSVLPIKTISFNMEGIHLGEECFRNLLILLMIAFAAAFIEWRQRILF